VAAPPLFCVTVALSSFHAPSGCAVWACADAAGRRIAADSINNVCMNRFMGAACLNFIFIKVIHILFFSIRQFFELARQTYMQFL
jgi:hypothetical protein